MAGKFGKELYLAVWQIKNLLILIFILTYIRMAIPYQTAKLKSAKIFCNGDLWLNPQIIPATISVP